MPQLCRALTLVCALCGAFAGATRAAEPPISENDPELQTAFALQRAYQKIVKRVAPCVVNLSAYSKVDQSGDDFHSGDMPFSQAPRSSNGSGVVIDEDGAILTNEHVIHGADNITVVLNDGSRYSARLVSSDIRSDLAVLKPLKPLARKLAAAVLADSDQVETGQIVLAIGNPFQLQNTLTVGVVSAKARSMPNEPRRSETFYANLIQTDAAINPGNSGGPLFNLKGEVVGINTFIFSVTKHSEGFGFAISSNDIKPRLEFLKAGRPVEYGWLGVVLEDLPTDDLNAAGPVLGVRVGDVITDMPAHRAGMRRGAVILAYDGQPVSTKEDLIAAVGRTPVGKVVKIKQRSDTGEASELSVRIGMRFVERVNQSRLDPARPVSEPPREGEFAWRGMRVRELSPDDARKAGGALRVVLVKKGSPADRAGFYEGALLDEFQRDSKTALVALTSLAQLKGLVEELRGPAFLHSSVLGYVQVENDE